MITEHVTTMPAEAGVCAEELRQAGRSSARLHVIEEGGRPHLPLKPPNANEVRDAALDALQVSPGSRGPRVVLEHMRLVRTAAKEVRDLERSLRQHPGIHDRDGRIVPRAYAITRDYLNVVQDRFSEETLAEFINGYQEIVPLNMGEIWALKPALQYVLLEHLEMPTSDSTPERVDSLRLIGETVWKHWFETVSLPDRVLARDPAGAYSAMDYDSRDLYRTAVSRLAKYSSCSEVEVAAIAVKLASEAGDSALGPVAAERRRHVGFYLIDLGLPQLRAAIGYRPPFIERVRTAVLNRPAGFYLIGVELLTFFIIGGLLSALDTLTPIVWAFFLLLLPATQAAVDFMNSVVSYLLRPRALPKLDFSEGIPDDCATMIAVPTLLLNERQVRTLVLDLEIRFLANRDRNLYFALLTDSPDADGPDDERDTLANTCREMIDALNERYGRNGHQPFLMLHRHRIYNPCEGRWMGWERKRGKLIDLNQLLRGAYDSFPLKAGDVSVFPRIRYVLTLDSDTQLPRDAAAKLVGTMAHPLNRAVVHPMANVVVEGYGILQPRIGISVESATRSRLAALYSGQTGFDIYTRAISDVYQDLFGEGIFTGKGIYEVDVFREVLENRFPENTLLSHDLIEGSYARAALVSDIELIDDYPSHFSAYSRRKHRWVRGDWQIMRWLLSRVPDFHGRIVANPMTVISQWKILDNLRRSLIEPATLVLFVAGWFWLPGKPWYWTVASLAMMFLPVYSNLLFSIARAPWGSKAMMGWARETLRGFLTGNAVTLLSVVFLLHQALLSLDAVVRSILRVLVTHRKMLEWETAAEAESQARRKSTVDVYLEWTPVIAALITIGLWLARPQAMPVAAPILFGWFASRGISDWLNRAPRARNPKLTSKDADLLRDSAERIWRFYRDWSTASNNWLVPDHVCEDGRVAQRLSPTNAGLLLNARIAAVHFGLMNVAEFAFETRKTLESIAKLPKYRGHLLNWYDVETLLPLEPKFVSTVDSGNFAACLWTVKQAALSFAAKPDISAELRADLTEIAEACEQMVQEMDFRFLYQKRKKVLSVGYDIAAERLEPSSYDLLASEARIASFVAIAKGDLPQEAWFHLGRGHTLFRGNRVLLSWTGTMFEYLMPALWMQQYPGTITEQSVNAAVKAQQAWVAGKGVPWGISESGCAPEEPGSDYGYSPFGVPVLAIRAADTEKLVISPYSTFLALPVDLKASVSNLRRMEKMGWSGRYGFYESADYSAGDPALVKSWMAHHQGMSLLAVCNVLYGDPIRKYFHAEPQVMATELLLHERIPATIQPEAEGPALLSAPEIVAVSAT